LDYLHKTIIPTMVKIIHGKSEDEMSEEEYAEVVQQVLKPYRLTSLSISTVVDGHEKPSTIAYWKAFCERYLGNEARMHCWVQITEKVAKKLEEEGEIARGSGYYYFDEVRMEKMVEFHVDASDK